MVTKKSDLYFFHCSWQIPFEMNDLLETLCKATSLQEKIDLLDDYPPVRAALKEMPSLLQGFSSECEAAGKQIIAIGQWDRLVGSNGMKKDSLAELLQKMAAFDAFYRELGGIVGYQEKVLKFLQGAVEEKTSEIAALHAPSFMNIAEETEEVLDAIAWGISLMPHLAEMYPLGGAADRLHLVDERTGSELPAAKLEYAGRTLFEGLIRDLSAREYLYFKLYGKQIETPVVIMTSAEKNNHGHVLSICEQLHWFGRRKELFRIFMQPLVPAVDSRGDWCLLGPCSPLLKPGGHGALWKMAYDQGVFQWLEGLGRTHALVRQLNNPIAAVDYGLLAFAGLGAKHEMIFGFASCPRLLRSAEGVNVVIEKINGEIALTNIEYCDFVKYGIEDQPLKEGEPYSRFSSNTNILFADLRAVANAVKVCPFPGLLVNFKDAAYTTLSGEKRVETMARLESTMQNIADVFVEKTADANQGQKRTRKTFVTYNHRNKTIATAKKAYVPGRSLQETPEECFYVQMQAARDLLEKRCQFDLPPRRSVEESLQQGLDCVFLYHPALGPLYSIIAQKISKGKLALGSELHLEIADILIENLDLDGSLLVHADQPIGHLDDKGILRYSDQTGRCVLRNVSVRNAGVDWTNSSPYWKHRFLHHGALRIHLRGTSEFIAENVEFTEGRCFEVPDGIRMKVRNENGNLVVEEERLCARGSKDGESAKGVPFWTYSFDERKAIVVV